MVDEADARSSMSALAILTCGQNSHPFQERHIPLNEPVKIGRSVARARPATDNGIFDCKVLSRNHAMLWYENGTFFLQDTKSSNGTFVNDQRLCKGGEESPPKEIYSGDLIQFGVNVMENNRRGEKITHGCIIATVNLLHPDGREAKPVLLNTPTTGITIQSQDLYKLAQYLQEALHREKMLEQKLSSLQELVHNTQESSEGGWQALIDEDRLLSRLEVLENQLHAYSKNHTEDTLRQELVTLQEEKLNYETTAKESLMKVLQEKIAATAKLSELERSLSKSEIECGHMREMCERAEKELLNLAEKFQDQLKAVHDMQIQLQDAEAKHMDEIEKLENDKLELNNKLEDMMKQEQMLNVKVDSFQTSTDVSMEHLTAMKVCLDPFKDDNENEHINNLKNADSDSQKFDIENKAVSSVIIPTSVDMDDNKDHLPEDVKGKLKETQQQIEEYKLKLEESENLILESAAKVEELQKNLETSRFDSLQNHVKIAMLEEKLKLSKLHMNVMVENTMADLKSQMSESSKQTLNSNELLEYLKGQVIELEQELAVNKTLPHEQSLDTTVMYSNSDMVDAATLRPKMRAEGAELEKSLHETKCLLAKIEDDLKCCRVELSESKLESKHLTEQISALKTELSQVHVTVSEKSLMVMNLQAQLQKAEHTTKEVKQQILTLRDQLKEEQNVTKLNQEKIASLTSALDEERTKHKETLQSLETTKHELEEKGSHEITKNSLTETKSLLPESQPIGMHVQNEATQLSYKLRQQASPEIVEFLNKDKWSTPEKRASPHLRYSCHVGDSPSRLPISKRQANELQTLKDECVCLRKRIQAIEAEMKMSQKENLQLSAEYNKLEESYKQLQAIKDQLQNRESTWMSNLTDSQKETESSKLELQNAKVEIERLKKHCKDCDQEIALVRGELKHVTGDFKRICNKSKLISFVSCMPLLMLLFALLLTLYPWVQPLTAATAT